MSVESPLGPLQDQLPYDGELAPLAELVNSVLGNRPLNKQPLLIASDLEEQLLRLGWPAGLRIGGEPALANRFGVGRDVLREVVRLLEARDHVRMRRGPGGGLEIIRPDLRDLIGRVSGYAYVSDIDRATVVETWVLLQAAAVRVLGHNPDFDWRSFTAGLGDKIAAGSRATGSALIDASGSRVLAILGALVIDLLPTDSNQSFGKSARGLLNARDSDMVLHWLRSVELPLLSAVLQTSPAERRIAPPTTPQGSCFRGQAMQLVHDLMSTTAPEEWRRGVLLGNEFDLADRFGVDKSVVRQAIRLMEDAETATSLPGRGRGLMTRLPSTAPLSRLLCAYFVAHGAGVADAEGVFSALRMECAGAAAEHATAHDKSTLLSMTQDVEGLRAPLPVTVFQSFERLQQHVAHNSLLGLSIDAVKAFLTWHMAACPIATSDILDAYKTHTREVALAICSGDRLAAINAEGRKLQALAMIRMD